MLITYLFFDWLQLSNLNNVSSLIDLHFLLLLVPFSLKKDDISRREEEIIIDNDYIFKKEFSPFVYVIL